MRIAVVGGGPGGLYLASIMKQLDSAHTVDVWERNAPDDTFGFGVVFSDETLTGIENTDPQLFARLVTTMARWDDIDVRHRGGVLTSGGHGFAAIARTELLRCLQERCLDLGVSVSFGAEAPDLSRLQTEYDLVVAADGANSGIRTQLSGDLGPTVARGNSRYMWLGTDLVFQAFTFDIKETSHGVVQLHGYPYSRTASTVVIETHDRVWQPLFGDIARLDLRPGESDCSSVALIADLFGDLLQGNKLAANNSKWMKFPTVRNARWYSGNTVLIGDAAHTAHFSIGSGTKLALEDAVALAACLDEHKDLGKALSSYEAERRPVVASTQRAAKASQEWFDDIGHYVDQPKVQFAFNIMTRSRRVTHDNLRVRDPEFVAATDSWFARSSTPGPPMFQPYQLGELQLHNRILLSAMDMYSADNGVPGDFHLTHLGSKAMGGAALVMSEMVCVSPTGRITPGCTGLYTAEQEQAWRRIVDFVHRSSPAKIGIQLGHSGRKGSTRLMWEGMDEPLPEGGWQVVGPSSVPYAENGVVPRALSLAELSEIREQFTASARAADRAGFDVLELHAAHGYLLSSFISPLSNTRTDSYGGTLHNRLRYPLEVFDAIKQVWPAHKPMTVRISATDWFPGGISVEDAVLVADAFARHGAAGIDVSTGQVVAAEAPEFGRSYQTPYADRIRNQVGRKYGVAVIAVGAISSWDDANSILLAGRADLCALGRPHLYDPHWTLHAAAEQDYRGPGAVWPTQFASGSRRPQTGRLDAPKPRLDLSRRAQTGTRHDRWMTEPVHAS